MVQNEILAQALAEIGVGMEIPTHLYQVVAEVLVYVMTVDGRYRKS